MLYNIYIQRADAPEKYSLSFQYVAYTVLAKQRDTKEKLYVEGI